MDVFNVKSGIWYYLYDIGKDDEVLMSDEAPIREDGKGWIHPKHGYEIVCSPFMFPSGKDRFIKNFFSKGVNHCETTMY